MRSKTKRPRVPRERTVEQFIGMFLRRGKPHADGTPGAFCVRFYVVERADLKPRRVEIGLRTSRRAEAAERALVLLSGLISTARIWLPERTLKLLSNTDLQLWFDVNGLPPTARHNYSAARGGDFTPARGCGGKPPRVVE